MLDQCLLSISSSSPILLLLLLQIFHATKQRQSNGGAVWIEAVDSPAALSASVPVFLRSQAARYLVPYARRRLLRERREPTRRRARPILHSFGQLHR